MDHAKVQAEGTKYPAMPRYMVLGFRQDEHRTPEEGQAMMRRWMAWFQALGDDLVDMGAPFTHRDAVGPLPTRSGATGYMVIQADDLDAAKGIVAGTPTVQDGGGLEVLEIMAMPGPE